jgi:hypothetical protein
MLMMIGAVAGLVLPLLPTGALVNVGLAAVALAVVTYQTFTRPATTVLFVGSAAYVHAALREAGEIGSFVDYGRSPAVTSLILLALWLACATAVAVVSTGFDATAAAAKGAIVATLRFAIWTVPLAILHTLFKLVVVVLKLFYGTFRLGVAGVVTVVTSAFRVAEVVVTAVAFMIQRGLSLVAAVVTAPFQAASYFLGGAGAAAGGSLPSSLANDDATPVVPGPARFLKNLAGALPSVVGTAVSGACAAAEGVVLVLVAVLTLQAVPFPEGFLQAAANKLFGGPHEDVNDHDSEAGNDEDDEDEALATTTTTTNNAQPVHVQVENGPSIAAAASSLNNADGVILHSCLALLRAVAERLFGDTAPVHDADSEAGAGDDYDDPLATYTFFRDPDAVQAPVADDPEAPGGDDDDEDDALATYTFYRVPAAVQAPVHHPNRRTAATTAHLPATPCVRPRGVPNDKPSIHSRRSSGAAAATLPKRSSSIAAATTAVSSRTAGAKASRAAVPSAIPSRAASSQLPRANRQGTRGIPAANAVLPPRPPATTRKSHSEVRRLALQSFQAQKKRDLTAMGGGEACESALPKRKKSRRS